MIIGILNQAVKSKQKTDEAEELEKVKLATNAALTRGIGTVTKENLKNELSQEFETVEQNLSEGTELWTFKGKQNIYTITSSGVVEVVSTEEYNKTKKCNTPKLTSGMTPVNYVNGEWVECTEEIWDWNYESQTSTTETGSGEGVAKWANAKTQDGSLWVWIPRFAYQIETNYHTNNAGKINVEFLQGTTNIGTDETMYSTTYDIDEATQNNAM